jgi:hypothetical protein
LKILICASNPNHPPDIQRSRRERAMRTAKLMPSASIPTSTALPCLPYTKLWWYSSVIA